MKPRKDKVQVKQLSRIRLATVGGWGRRSGCFMALPCKLYILVPAVCNLFKSWRIKLNTLFQCLPSYFPFLCQSMIYCLCIFNLDLNFEANSFDIGALVRSYERNHPINSSLVIRLKVMCKFPAYEVSVRCNKFCIALLDYILDQTLNIWRREKSYQKKGSVFFFL